MLFVGLVLGLEAALTGVLTGFVGIDEAVGRAAAMLPPVLWSARLVVAVQRGRITRRLVRWGGPGVNTTFFRITNPEVYNRSDGVWTFRGYVLYETALCLVVWALFGGGVVLAPILSALGVDMS